MTGFGAERSDIDMCLVAKSMSNVEPRLEAVANLMELKKFLLATTSELIFHYLSGLKGATMMI